MGRSRAGLAGATIANPTRRSITFNNGLEFAHHNKLEYELSLLRFFN